MTLYCTTLICITLTSYSYIYWRLKLVAQSTPMSLFKPNGIFKQLNLIWLEKIHRDICKFRKHCYFTNWSEGKTDKERPRESSSIQHSQISPENRNIPDKVSYHQNGKPWILDILNVFSEHVQTFGIGHRDSEQWKTSAWIERVCRYSQDKYDIDGLVQDCSNSSALAMELLQPCTKPPIWCKF